MRIAQCTNFLFFLPKIYDYIEYHVDCIIFETPCIAYQSCCIAYCELSPSVVLCNHRDHKPRISAHGKRHISSHSISAHVLLSLFSFVLFITFMHSLSLTFSHLFANPCFCFHNRYTSQQAMCGSVGMLSLSFSVIYEMLGREHLSLVSRRSYSVQMEFDASF